MFFNILATFAEFESDLIRLRTREGMRIARDKGKLRGKPPKISDLQQRELLKMHATGEYSINDLGKLFKVSRPTVYRTIRRGATGSIGLMLSLWGKSVVAVLGQATCRTSREIYHRPIQSRCCLLSGQRNSMPLAVNRERSARAMHQDPWY